MKKCEDYKGLLVGLLDHELDADETNEINTHLIRCAACQADYENLRETSGKLEAVSFVEPGDVVLDQVWNRPYSRLMRNSALLLIIGGYATLLLYALFEFVRSGDEVLIVRVAVASIALGVLFLLVQLVRERCKLSKIDSYKHIKR